MIVSEVMTTRLITITPGDTLSHAANLLRQYQFHHLPVVRATQGLKPWGQEYGTQVPLPILEGLITSDDIDFAASLGAENSLINAQHPWEERHVGEVMHRSIMR